MSHSNTNNHPLGDGGAGNDVSNVERFILNIADTELAGSVRRDPDVLALLRFKYGMYHLVPCRARSKKKCMNRRQSIIKYFLIKLLSLRSSHKASLHNRCLK